MTTPSGTAHWDDTILVVDNAGKEHRVKEVSMEDLLDQLSNDPSGIKTVRVDKTLDLTSLGATTAAFHSLPAGAVVKYAAIHILETVVAGGTTVKVALGVSAGDVDKYGITADLVAETKAQNLFNTTPASAETLVLGGVVTAGTTLGDTNISAGSVRMVMIYDTAAVLS